MKNIDLKQLTKNIFKYLIITLLIWFVKIVMFGNVNAEVVKVNLSDFKFNNINFLDLSYYNIPEGNRTLFFDYDYNSINESATILYNSVVLCSDAKYTSAYATDPSEVANIRMNNTNYSCSYSNSSYTLGKVVIITFVTYSSGSNSIVLYQNDNASVQLIDFVVDSSSYVNPMNYSSQSLINQNSQIINQNTTIINKQDQTNSKLDDLNSKTDKTNQELKDMNDYLKDNTNPNVDVSSLGTVSGLLPAGPVDSLLNIPFKFLSVLSSSVSGACVPVSTNWVFNTTLNIPCFSEQFYSEVPTALMTFLQVVPCAFILIKYFKHLYKKVDRAVTMNTTADDEWGVI